MAIRTGLTVDYNVPITMRDGTVLVADVFRPARPGRYPVILVRTPYGKLSWPMGLAAFGADPLALVRAGYVVVIQDSRGTGASEGMFRALRDEGIDGAESVAWAAVQPWSDGGVAMAGPSYMGGTQLLAAAQSPPALRAIAPFVSYVPETTYQGGAFQLGFSLWWAAMMALAQLVRQEAGENVSERREELEAIIGNPWTAYRRLPLLDLASITPWLDSTYGAWLRQPGGDDFWRAAATEERCATFATPALHIAGWHDLFLSSSLATYGALRRGAATEPARTNQRLIVTPWGHRPSGEVVGDLWYGPGANFDLYGAHLEWFNAWLKGDPLPERDSVQLFVQGANRWRDEPDWPLARAVQTRWYLRKDGSLSLDPPDDEQPNEFVYDPRDPVPTVSGQSGVFGRDGAFSVGPRDRRAVQTRRDVLVYTSDVLQEDMEVTGPVTATLHVASSALDTDFTAALVDVYPDGRAIGLTDGILRLRYREGLDRQRLLEPGRAYEVEIDLVATSNLFVAGHRIAIEISSSNFPRFDRNPNHGGQVADATETDFVVASQTVFHDADRASHISLPIIPVS